MTKKWRIEKRRGKLYRQRYWDDLSYEQFKICLPYYDFMGIFCFNKNKEKWRKKVIESGLSDYVFWKEIKQKKERK
ncbi:MAG: hypothetical protein PHD04_03465 [Candidatus Pacebacteria bacterium]|nr:hypothetical protein [Candidatus Paceibacterota bacterium]